MKWFSGPERCSREQRGCLISEAKRGDKKGMGGKEGGREGRKEGRKEGGRKGRREGGREGERPWGGRNEGSKKNVFHRKGLPHFTDGIRILSLNSTSSAKE